MRTCALESGVAIGRTLKRSRHSCGAIAANPQARPRLRIQRRHQVPVWSASPVAISRVRPRLSVSVMLAQLWRREVRLCLPNWDGICSVMLAQLKLKRPAAHGLAAFHGGLKIFSHCRLHFVGRYEIIHPVFDKRKSEAARRLKTQESPNVFPHPMRTVPCAHF